MSFADFEDFCAHTVTVEPFLSNDQYGLPTYGTPVVRKAYIQGQNQLVTMPNGEEAVSHIQVYIDTSSVGPRDRVTLPSHFSPTTPNILAVKQVSDERGLHHVVVMA